MIENTTSVNVTSITKISPTSARVNTLTNHGLVAGDSFTINVSVSNINGANGNEMYDVNIYNQTFNASYIPSGKTIDVNLTSSPVGSGATGSGMTITI